MKTLTNLLLASALTLAIITPIAATLMKLNQTEAAVYAVLTK